MSRFWIISGGSGTGNWDAATTTHWSTATGGSSGAAIPTSTDSVLFDGNSFNGASQTVTNTATANCLDLNWTGATNTPTWAGSSAISVYGSLTLIAGMTLNFIGNLTMASTSTGKTFTSAGKTFSGQLIFDGAGGGWTLQDALTANGAILQIGGGTLNTNNQAVNASVLNMSGGNARGLILGSSIVTISSNFTGTNPTNLTFNAGTSTIVMTGAIKNFSGGGLTYYNVTFSGTSVTVSGGNTYNTITITPGKTVTLTAGTTQTFTTLSAMGTLGNVITIQSNTSGTPATISRNGGTVVFNYCSIKDITATGGATFNAYNSTNVSGNTGINFLGGDPPTGYAHQVMGQTISKIVGVTPSKVNGV